MRDWIPIPGTTKARLVDAAIHQFEQRGYEAVNVAELAAKASTTTGALYHHFDSKLGLYLVVREEMERRIVERMEGAAAATEGDRWHSVRSALLVAFDAACRFSVCRILGESPPIERGDPIEGVLQPLVPNGLAPVAGMLAAAWRAALLEVAAGRPTVTVRPSLAFLLTAPRELPNPEGPTEGR